MIIVGKVEFLKCGHSTQVAQAGVRNRVETDIQDLQIGQPGKPLKNGIAKRGASPFEPLKVC